MYKDMGSSSGRQDYEFDEARRFLTLLREERLALLPSYESFRHTTIMPKTSLTEAQQSLMTMMLVNAAQ